MSPVARAAPGYQDLDTIMEFGPPFLRVPPWENIMGGPNRRHFENVLQPSRANRASAVDGAFVASLRENILPRCAV